MNSTLSHKGERCLDTTKICLMDWKIGCTKIVKQKRKQVIIKEI